MRGWIECLVLKQMNDIFVSAGKIGKIWQNDFIPLTKSMFAVTPVTTNVFIVVKSKKLKPLNNFNRPVFVGGLNMARG